MMVVEKDKIKCIERHCNWRGKTHQLLISVNPFDKDETIYGCPDCKTIDNYVGVCDEPECWEEVSCGTSTKDGYRSTCYKHQPPYK